MEETMTVPETVEVDFLCPVCGFATRQGAHHKAVYCKYKHRGRFLTPMKQITSLPVGELQVKAK